MAETQTLTERRQQVERQQKETKARLEELAAERSTWGLRAVEGESKAVARVAEIDQEVAELEGRRNLVESALGEIEELERAEKAEATEERRQQLTAEFDELVSERRKALRKFEKALDGLEAAVDTVLDVDTRQRKIGAELGVVPPHLAAYDGMLRDRTLTRFGRLLGTGPTTYRREPLSEQEDVLTLTSSESKARHEEDMRRREERRREEERVRAAVARREEIMQRRDVLRAEAGWATAHPSHRPEIEAKVEEWIRQEFGEEAS